MTEELSGHVIGQDQAIIKVTKAIQRNRVGLKDPKKPIGTFVFLGPTGVGKTKLAKELARKYSNNFIKINCAEYTGKNQYSKLIGAPPGYIGYSETSLLGEKAE